MQINRRKIQKAAGFLLALLVISSSCQGQSDTTESSQELTILSWNVKFLPRFLGHLKHYPMKRVPHIANALIEDQVDIIVFQEAFDRSCNRKLQKLLHFYYPYTIGPANQKVTLKISSGVMIMSKLPIRELGTIDFEDCEGVDCHARKGALLVETEFNGQRIQILGTHLEAGGSRELKIGQYRELAGLLNEYRKDGVPQFAAGDYNTHKFQKDTTLYPKMLDILEATDGPITGELKFSSDATLNDMQKFKPSKKDVIDFILYRGNGIDPVYVRREVIRYTARWSKKHEDLSDHFAIKMTVRF